jgi:uncharacterized protein YjbI with pentapeptide repeats
MRFLDLRRTDLRGFQAYRTHFSHTDFSYAKLTGASFFTSYLQDTKFRHVVGPANFAGTLLRDADFTGADLAGSNFATARMIGTNFTAANLDRSYVYGTSVWDVNLTDATQRDLRIGRESDHITVDNLELAQLIYLLANNTTFRELLDTVTSKVVLLLGSFAPNRLAILQSIKDILRDTYNLVPVLFTFQPPKNMDLVQSVVTLAHLSRYVIADISEPQAVPQELQAIIQSIAIPVRPIMQLGTPEPSGVFASFLASSDRITKIYRYRDLEHLRANFARVLEPAELALAALRSPHSELFE